MLLVRRFLAEKMISYFITYVCFWWVAFLIALPIGVTSEDNKIGIEASPPKQTYLWRKVICVSLISIPLTFFLNKYFKLYLMSLL